MALIRLALLIYPLIIAPIVAYAFIRVVAYAFIAGSGPQNEFCVCYGKPVKTG